MQIRGEFAYGTGPVRHFVFLPGGHLREGSVVSVGDEQRVEPESLVPRFPVDDAPLDDPFEKVLFAVQEQRYHRAEPCPAVGLPFEVFQQQPVVGREVVPVGGVACRVYARGPAQRFDFEPVSSAKQSIPVRSCR